jgi:hypothetical protein
LLEVGHADEVILPLPGSCPLSIAYASPLKAFSLLNNNKTVTCTKLLMKNLNKIGFQTKKDCESLLSASLIYEDKI